MVLNRQSSGERGALWDQTGTIELYAIKKETEIKKERETGIKTSTNTNECDKAEGKYLVQHCSTILKGTNEQTNERTIPLDV